ncbi:hypothetical protein THRCLA_20200 [Thraustotheca clavata]|uniref:Uncharacterized protein n=1 Tax=Thraustotheca clavata TaxID=74557 RepID=A0A1W0AAD5_9STRA|nr:hypothetical protein THRCLA_20200 [Thraustotheca clavata]
MNNETSPLFFAAQNGHKGTISSLLSNGANVHQADNNGVAPLFAAAGKAHKDIVICTCQKEQISIKQTTMEPHHSHAVQNGHKDIASLLLSNGTNIHEADKDGRTPLSIAAFNGHKGTVSLLLSRGAYIDQAMSDGAKPLFIAAHKCHKDIVSLLLSNGANIHQARNVQDIEKGGWTSLLSLLSMVTRALCHYSC